MEYVLKIEYLLKIDVCLKSQLYGSCWTPFISAHAGTCRMMHQLLMLGQLHLTPFVSTCAGRMVHQFLMHWWHYWTPLFISACVGRYMYDDASTANTWAAPCNNFYCSNKTINKNFKRFLPEIEKM